MVKKGEAKLIDEAGVDGVRPVVDDDMLVRIEVGDTCPLADDTEDDIDDEVPLRIDSDKLESPV